MDTITQAVDSRSMLLSEPSTAPSAFSLWRWLSDRVAAKVTAQEANVLRVHAHAWMPVDPGLAKDLRAAANPHAQPHDC
jgi:hypothetical protein